MRVPAAWAGMSGQTVLVTGGSGFVGAHCILQLLHAGYRIRTTVPSLEREADLRAMLEQGGSEPGGELRWSGLRREFPVKRLRTDQLGGL